MKYWLLIGAISLLGACASTPAVQNNKQFNEDEFVGLESLGNSYEDLKLDYDLDGVEGKAITFKTCSDVEKTTESAVVQDQYQLLMLMKENCYAARLYFAAPDRSLSFLPKSISGRWIKQLPASAVPNLGGDSLSNKTGRIAEVQPILKVISESEKSVEVGLSGDLNVTYVLLAKGDFNADGVEDMLLRMDWSITSAFGNGFELIMITQRDSGKAVELVNIHND